MLKSNRPDTERASIVACVASLCEAFNRKPTHATFVAYDLGLDGIPVESVERACCNLFQQDTPYMPSPGQLRKLADSGSVSIEDRSALAFMAIKPAVSKVGHWGSPDFDDPLINAAIRHLGGWQRVCDLETEEFEKWYRKDFIAAYELFARCGADETHIAPLVGAVEASNVASGYTQPEHANRTRIATGLPWSGQPIKRLGSAQSNTLRIASNKE